MSTVGALLALKANPIASDIAYKTSSSIDPPSAIDGTAFILT